MIIDNASDRVKSKNSKNNYRVWVAGYELQNKNSTALTLSLNGDKLNRQTVRLINVKIHGFVDQRRHGISQAAEQARLIGH